MIDDPNPERTKADPVRATEVRIPRARTQEELVALFSTPVWRFVSSQLPRREDAEDVVMEVFASAFSSFGSLERATDQRLWLLGVARHKVADARRKRYQRAEQPYEEAVAAPETAAPTDELRLAMRTALDTLPSDQSQALVLKYVNGLSTEEVSAVLRKSLQATNSLLQRGRESMRRLLGPAVFEPSTELR
jgi:RNA polymerase sigma-70 factor (ECF subfamily)